MCQTIYRPILEIEKSDFPHLRRKAILIAEVFSRMVTPVKFKGMGRRKA